MAKRQALPALDVERFIEQLAVPEGFTKTRGTEDYSWGKEKILHPSVTLSKGTEIEIKIVLSSPDAEYIRGSGHTSFDTKLGRRTFDRRGVDDSFYVDDVDTVETVNEKVKRQIEKVAESVSRLARSMSVPKWGFSVTPEQLDEIKAKLNKGQSHTFTPAGFGTGYVISKPGRKRNRWAKPAPQEIVDFFGVGRLEYDTLDCD